MTQYLVTSIAELTSMPKMEDKQVGPFTDQVETSENRPKLQAKCRKFELSVTNAFFQKTHPKK